MSTLNDAKMPRLLDKHLEQEAEAVETAADSAEVEAKKGKGRRIKSKSKN